MCGDGNKDPFASIRRDVPPPGHPIGMGKEYNKNKHRKNKKKLIEEELMEYWDELGELTGSIVFKW